jgi:pilus assembly protein Flp/PilA
MTPTLSAGRIALAARTYVRSPPQFQSGPDPALPLLSEEEVKMNIRNQRGQGLIEYVILVALVGVATMGMVRLLQKSVNVNLANIVHGLQSDGRRRETHERITEDDLRKKDFSDFLNGAASPNSRE